MVATVEGDAPPDPKEAPPVPEFAEQLKQTLPVPAPLMAVPLFPPAVLFC
jgi:hypothetical protein